jgi:hypothetical protein
MRSAAACAQIIELHLAFDSFLVLQLLLPVEIGLVVEHD